MSNQPLLHNFNGQTIWLSKSNGLFKTYRFGEFPKNTTPYFRYPFVATPTIGDIYDLDVGDEFESIDDSERCYGGSTYSRIYKRVVNKYYSSNMDTVYYVWQIVEWKFRNYPPDSTYLTKTATTFHTDLSNTMFGNVLPEQNFFTGQSFSPVVTYSLFNDSATFCGRLSLSSSEGFLYSSDTCINANHFEPLCHRNSFSVGLGQTIHNQQTLNFGLIECHSYLYWYRKKNETCGKKYLITSTPEIYNTEIFKIYPNPVSADLKIESTVIFSGTKLFNPFGEKVLESSADINKLDLSYLKAGIYFLRITTEKGIYSKKIIKIN
jgi:hypothetical protein